VVLAGKIGDRVIGLGGEDQSDVASRARLDDEGTLEDFVGNVVGCDNDDAHIGGLNHAQQTVVERIATHIGSTGDDLKLGLAFDSGDARWLDVFRLLMTGIIPVCDEDLIDHGRSWPLDLCTKIRSALMVGFGPDVLIGDVVTSDDGGVLIEDRDLTVISQISRTARRER